MTVAHIELSLCSDLPIIISLELHVCLEQQAVMVEIMREIWGDALLDQPVGNFEDVDKIPLASPAELKGKILIKVKRVAEKKVELVEEASSLPTVSKVKTSSSSLSSDTEHAGTEKVEKKKKPISVAEALSKLGIYTRSYHFSSLEQPGMSAPRRRCSSDFLSEASIPTHVFSLSEKTLMGMHETQGTALFRHNRVGLLRDHSREKI